MKMTFLGHACVHIETNGTNIVIDPFISGNPACPAKLEDIQADVVILTHAHGDHWGDSLALAERGAMLIGTWEIGMYAQKHGAKNAVAMNIGGTFRQPWGSLKLVPAWHSSSFPDGTYGGMPCGVVLNLEGKNIYHSGDTALFSDMTLIGDIGLDFAFVCAGDFYTMGPEDALKALKLLRPKAVTPIHHSTFDGIRQDAQAFCSAAEGLGVRGHPLAPGQSVEL
jgi:L-ascorbate metabolism protein UlaG (beta-lactamase superfamily)